MSNSLSNEKISSIVDNSLAKTHWKKFKEFGNEKQMVYSIGHFSPEIKMDRTLVDGGLISGGPAPTMATGVKYTKEMTRGNLKDFYKVMKANAAAGWLPGYTPEMIEKMRTEQNKSHPEEFDMVADIAIMHFDDGKTARQALENQKQVSEGSFLGAQVPGMPDGTSINDALNTKKVQAKLTEEQKAQLEKLQPLMKNAETKIKADRAKVGLNNRVEKLFGYDSLVTIKDNKRYYSAMAINNFLVSGSFLSSVSFLPDGNTPCESVSQFNSKKITERVEGKSYERTEVSPKKSTLAAEGFLNKTEAEEIIKKIIEQL